jgi:hypothetical protein
MVKFDKQHFERRLAVLKLKVHAAKAEAENLLGDLMLAGEIALCDPIDDAKESLEEAAKFVDDIDASKDQIDWS